MTPEAKAAWFRERYAAIRSEVEKAIVGQGEVVDAVLTGMAANGHVLLEGLPGLGKTKLVHALSRSLAMDFSRIQFTPDLMPADITGTHILQQGAFEFRKGPIFAHIVLADEINRATPKTQAALLEAMQERSVTAGGKRFVLEEPFLVMATQNPIEQEGTYPLPEAQLDRFLLKVLVPFPSREELAEIVVRTTGAEREEPHSVASREDVLNMRDLVREVTVSEPVLQTALTMVLATHPETQEASPEVKRFVRYGASPRGAQALVTVGKIRALLAERFNVSRDDLRAAAHACLRHRIVLNFDADADGVRADDVIDSVLAHTERTDLDPIRV